jgi:gliding motility-associated-like protein
LIDSVKTLTQNQYSHKNAFLQANTWQYFVIVRNDCTGSPTLSSDTLNIDLTQPFDQLIDSVSVDPITGKYIIGWKKNISLDLAGYKIYEVVGNNNVELANLNNNTNLYSDLLSDPNASSKIYSIAAYDSCNNITAIIDKHQPIKLSVSFDSCSKVFTLNWSKYIGMNMLKYRILLDVNSAGFIKYKEVSSISQTYSFPGNSFNQGDQVCFEVRGFKSTDTSVTTTSNHICLTVDFADTATINYISSASVIDHDRCSIDWITDNSDLISVIVLRQSSDGLNFITRRQVKPNTNTLSFQLDSLNTDSLNYYFKVLAYNSCGQLQGSSNICRTILLQAAKLIPGINQVDWTKYLEYQAGVSEYQLFHGTGDISQGYTFTQAAIIDSNGITYNDTKLPSEIANDGVCYYIKAIEAPGNIYGVNGAESKSNMVCVSGDMLVFYPNIFRPNSLFIQNKVFKPNGVFINYKKSTLTIYDRWGNLVYQTSDLSNGWDGNDSSGKPLDNDSFVYFSIVYPIKGKPQEFKGMVYLQR